MTEQISDRTPSETKPAYFKDRETWTRGIFMLLFIAIYHLTAAVVAAVAVLQFAWKLVAGAANPRLTEFGEGLSRYFYQIARFLTFNSDEKPFPFTDWPSQPPA